MLDHGIRQHPVTIAMSVTLPVLIVSCLALRETRMFDLSLVFADAVAYSRHGVGEHARVRIRDLRAARGMQE